MDGVEFRDEPGLRVVSIAEVADYLFNIEANPHVDIKPFLKLPPQYRVKHGYYRRGQKRVRPPKY